MSALNQYEKPEDVQYYETGEPIPDGYVIIVFKEYPWDDGYLPPSVGDAHFKIRFDMSDVKFFTDRMQYFGVRLRNENILQHYPWHNILYIENQLNSDYYVEASQKWKKQQAYRNVIGDDVTVELL